MSMAEGGAAAPRLVCCGNLTIDDVVLPDGRARPGCIGGDALYGALAARLLLPDAEMLAPVGCDLPPSVWALIAARGFSREGLPQRDCPTIRTRFVYETADRRVATLLSDQADFDTLSPRGPDVPPRYWGARAFMVLAMSLSAQRDLVADLRAGSDAIIALDPQEEYIAGNEAAVLDLVSRVDVFMPSRDEVSLLAGDRTPQDAARYFAGLGPRIVVIKLGAAGCLVHDRDTGRFLAQPAYPGVVVDTTGAGDAFCCAFMASLVLAPHDLARAARAGAKAASLAVAGFGTEGFEEGLLF